MIIDIFLTSPTMDVPINNQTIINGFIHAILGKDNKWHDKFSTYSISSLQGGRLAGDKKNLVFPGEPCITVASENHEFISDLMLGLSTTTASAYGMTYKRVGVRDFKIGKNYDIIYTTSPILLIKDRWKLTIDKNNVGAYVDALTEHCKKKLKHEGIVDDTFEIKIKYPEYAKTKCVWVGDIFNVCTICNMMVFGREKTRRTLYNLGLGGSTGSGFGSVKICEPRCY